MSHGSAAKAARENKERHPEFYCPVARCLWRTGGGRCPRHPGTIAQELAEMEARDPKLKALGERIDSMGQAIAAHPLYGVPKIGTRYRIDHGQGFHAVVEYIGPNPDAEFPTADAHLIRRISSTDQKHIGEVSKVDVLWFGNHRMVAGR